MEKYVEQTEVVIGIVQERMTDESFEKSTESSQRMYEFISNEAETEQLNIYELLNAVGTIYLATLELALESTKGE